MAQKSTYEDLEKRIEEYEKEISSFRVTDEKRKYSSMEWRTIFDAITDAVCMIDPEGTITRCNKAMTDLLEKPFDAVIGATCWEIVHGTSEPIEGCPIIRMRETRKRESRVLQMAGGSFNVFADPLLDEKGNIISAVHIISDITERKQAEDELKFEREQLFSIFESIVDGVYVSDIDTHKILYANQTAKDAFQKDLIGGICFKEFHGFDSPCEFCTNDIILRQKPAPYRWEHQNLVLDKVYAIIDRIIRWPDGRDVRLEIALDITDRKRAEESLRKSEKRFRDLANSSPAGISIIRGDQYLYVNPSWEDLTGYTKEDAQTLNPLSVAHPDMRELVRSRAEDRIKGEPVPMRYEIKGINKKGEVIWHDFAGTVIDYDNEPAILCISADLTDRKRAEEDRERLINELQEALDNIKTLKGLLPICSECKKIRDDKGYWKQIESYIESHSDALFSHGLCPECLDNLYGDQDWYKKEDFEK